MKTTEGRTSLAIMAIFFIIPGALIVNPAIQSIAEAYPTISYTIVLLLSTIPMLIVVPTSLLAGAIAGNKVTYKTLLLVAIILYVVGGTMPFFIRNFYATLVARAIYGVGVGLATPLANALVIRLFDGQKRVNMMGMGSVIINVASTVFMLLSGVISAIDLNYIWLIHLIALIPLVLMMMFLPEMEPVEHHSSGKVKIPVSVFVLSISLCFVYMNLNPLLLNMSTIIISEQLGNAAVAGTVLSMYTVGGIVGGAIFSGFFKIAGKMTIPLALIILGFGLGISNFAHSIFMLIIGCTIAGIGFFIIFPAILMEVGQKVSLAASAMVSAMILASINLGGFLSSFYIVFLNTVFNNNAPRLPILIGAIVILLVAIVCVVVTIGKKPVDLFCGRADT